jgi:hypothetical protein
MMRGPSGGASLRGAAHRSSVCRQHSAPLSSTTAVHGQGVQAMCWMSDSCCLCPLSIVHGAFAAGLLHLIHESSTTAVDLRTQGACSMSLAGTPAKPHSCSTAPCQTRSARNWQRRSSSHAACSKRFFTMLPQQHPRHPAFGSASRCPTHLYHHVMQCLCSKCCSVLLDASCV